MISLSVNQNGSCQKNLKRIIAFTLISRVWLILKGLVFFFFKQVDDAVFELSPEIFYAFPVTDPLLLQDFFGGVGFCYGLLDFGLPQHIGNFHAAVFALELLTVVFVVAIPLEDKSDTGRIGRL